MKFSKTLITAFVSSTSTNQERNAYKGHLCVFPATGPVSELPPGVDCFLKESSHSVVAWQSHPRNEVSSPLNIGVREWLVPSAYAAAEASPPTQDEIKLLRDAFATFYGVDRDLEKSEQLLTKVIDAWQRQPPDEKAGLYRVRGDCYMALLQPKNAENDYSTAIDFLQGPGGDQADPSELPTSLLGRARAIRSQGKEATLEQTAQAAKDYQLSLRLSSREEWDTDAENEEDGVSRNPYAAWEWGATLRSKGDLEGAVKVHKLASESFDDIGDKARSIISQMDEGIDLAALGKKEDAKETIMGAIKNMKKLEGGDVDLLQRLLAKEGESRIALASVLWDAGERPEAESLLGTACYRLEQLEADAQKRLAARKGQEPEPRVKFSIDDQIGAGISCSRFRNERFLSDTIDWPESLQKKVMKLNALEK